MVGTLLSELRRLDIQVWADGDRLRCDAPAGALTPELRDQLRRHKGDILAFLGSARTLSPQARAIVPLQPRGTRPPIFGVAGHNGDVFCFRALARHLGDEQPLYGLEPPGLDGKSEPLTRIEELAAYFAAQVRAFRPDGPCVIAGFCTGGTIAFELGRQLLREGAPIGVLALFGAPYPTAYRPLTQLRQRLGRLMGRVVKHSRAVAARSTREWQSYIVTTLHDARAQRAGETRGVPDSVLLLRAGVERATLAAARRYAPAHFAGRVALFLPCEAWARSSDEPLRWRSVAQEVEEYFGPDGCTSDNMLGEPYAATFAELFRSSAEPRGGSDA